MTVADLLGMPLLLLLLPIVAFLYASVGHGGASGYLALMSAFSFPMTYIKPTALVLNISGFLGFFLFLLPGEKLQMELVLSFRADFNSVFVCGRLFKN